MDRFIVVILVGRGGCCDDLKSSMDRFIDSLLCQTQTYPYRFKIQYG